MTITPAPIDPPEVHAKLWEGFSGEVGWDIGANVGQSLGEMAQRFERVVTFEPAIECHSLLVENASLFKNVVFSTLALSDRDGEIELIDIPDKIDTGQLVSREALGMEYNPNQPEATARKIKAVTVDTFAQSSEAPDFMKIDVEGHELEVLKGARNTLIDKMPDMLIEIHSEALGKEIFKLLQVFQYSVEIVRHPHYTASRGLAHMYNVHYWLRCFA